MLPDHGVDDHDRDGGPWVAAKFTCPFARFSEHGSAAGRIECHSKLLLCGNENTQNSVRYRGICQIPQVVGKRTSAGQQIGSQHHTAPLFAFLFRFYEDHLSLPVEYGTRVYGKDEGHISGFIRGAKE
jgi:hypothetical protein